MFFTKCQLTYTLVFMETNWWGDELRDTQPMGKQVAVGLFKVAEGLFKVAVQVSTRWWYRCLQGGGIVFYKVTTGLYEMAGGTLYSMKIQALLKL